MEDDEPVDSDDSAASEADGSADDTAASEQPAGPVDPGEHLLALERARDPQGNEKTRPPDDEVVTFRSMTVVEMYAGQAIDALKDALATIEWVNLDTPIVDRIVVAQKGYTYSRGVFWLEAEGSASVGGLLGHGRTTLPAGFTRIYGEYYVLGPSLVALVLTFVLNREESKRLDAALRDDAESRLDRLAGGGFSHKSVRDVKKERIRNVRDDIGQRCRSWIKDKMPGTLSAVQQGLGPPTCALVGLTQGVPFQTHSEYMALLDLVNEFLAERFVVPDFLFLAYPIDVEPNNRMLGAFNEGEAVAQQWVSDASATPECFHEAISSSLIADGIYAVLLSYEPKLRDMRNELNRLDFDKATGQEVAGLRNRLLGISRDVSTVCSDVTILVNDAFAFWSDLYPVVRLRRNATSSSAEETADAKRRLLRAVIASLETQESNLRELILITSASTTETRSLELQTNVLNLTTKLNGLTTWLIILTFVLVALGVAALLVQIFHVPVVHVQLPR
jgi:hypothetical protein